LSFLMQRASPDACAAVLYCFRAHYAFVKRLEVDAANPADWVGEVPPAVSQQFACCPSVDGTPS